jgi:alpha-beta hydrolase superfamily lysophospholipase
MNLAVFDALRDALPGVESWAIDLPGHGRSAWCPARADFDSQVEAERYRRKFERTERIPTFVVRRVPPEPGPLPGTL